MPCATEPWTWSSACAWVTLLQTELSHSRLPRDNSASRSPHFSSVQLVLLKEFIKVIQDYSMLLNTNTDFLYFLNTVLSVNCPKFHCSSTYRLSTFSSSLITTAGRWHGMDKDTQLCSFYYVAGSGSSPHTLNLYIKTKNSAVIIWVII